MKGFLLGFGLMSILILCILRLVYDISLDMKCTQYLKRAADANTVELAKQNIETAIKYLEKNDLTNGVVSIFLHQPSNDIGYWYTNLKASLDELSKVDEKTSQLEKTNILMKLRETLTDQGDKSIAITCPTGISIYPYNALFFWLFVGAFISMIIGISMLVVDF